MAGAPSVEDALSTKHDSQVRFVSWKGSLKATATAPMVATVLDPPDRPRLEAASGGSFAAVHLETVSDAMRSVRERPISAVLVSPQRVPRDQLPGLARLVRGYPEVPLVAVLSSHGPEASERLLQLGAFGVRSMIDLSRQDGWHRLRDVVARQASPTASRILARVLPPLVEATLDARRFFDAMVRVAPETPTVRALTKRLRVRSSTFMSRFFRADLPSPKRYLTTTRLLHATTLFEVDEFSVADVAYRLDYSSPQSFGRHVKATVGLTAAEFRRRYTFDHAIEDYIRRLILPYRAIFAAFQPLEE
jgi:AraC-like DNA-binding protein